MDRRQLIEEYQRDHSKYEVYSQLTVEPGMFALRLDGRGFSSLTKNLEKPFDMRFHAAMDKVAESLMQEISEAIYCYCQSDEISILMPMESQFFGRRVEKLCSVAAATATLSFYRQLEIKGIFDARVLHLPTAEDALAMLAERQSDARKNSLSMLVYWTLRNQGQNASAATKSLKGLTSSERKELLEQLNNPFDNLSPELKLGRSLTRQSVEHRGYNPITREHVLTMRRHLFWQRQLEDFSCLTTLPWEQNQVP